MDLAASLVIAVVLADALLLLASRSYFSRHSINEGGVQAVKVFGRESHILTFLKVAGNAVGRFFLSIKQLPKVRVSAFLLLLGTAGVAAGQIMRENGTKDWVSGGLILAGLALFTGGGLLLKNNLSLEDLLSAPARLIHVQPVQVLMLISGVALSVATAYLAGAGPLMKHPTGAVICYLAGVFMVITGTWQKGNRLSENARNAFIWAAGLTLVALPLRAYQIGSMPIVLNGDEGSFGLMAIEILEGKSNNIFGIGWFSFPLVSFAVLAIPIKILGHTVAAVRITSALVGSLTVGATYLAARRIFNHPTAILAAFFLAVLHYHIQFSRLAVNNIWDGLFFVITLGCLWSAWFEEKRGYFIGAGLALGFSQYFYTSSRVMVLIVPLFIAGLALRDRARLRRVLPDLILMVLTTLVVYLPHGLFFLQQPNEFFAPMNRVSLNPDWFYYTARDMKTSYAGVMLNQIKLSLQAYTDANFRMWYDSQSPMLLTIPSIVFFLSMVLILVKKQFRQVWLLGCWLGSITLLGALSQDAPAAQRYVAAAPAVAMLVGFGLKAFLDVLVEYSPRWQRVWAGLLVVVVAWISWGEFQHYFLEYIPRSFYDENTITANYIAKYVKDKPAGTVVCLFAEPQMGYDSISSLPYLAPNIIGKDCQFPPTEDRPTQADGAVNVFYPHRTEEMVALQEAYPDGKLIEVPGVYRPVLLWLYDLSK